jgi:uncharacterized membrane protein YphA (DoxX/SURF4 family)
MSADNPTANVDLRYLGWTRAAIGALILIRTTPILLFFHIWYVGDTGPLLGWPDGSWDLTTLPVLAIQIACIVRTIAAALFMVGIYTRSVGLVCGLAGYVVMSQNPFGFFFTAHLLYQAAILLALSDAGATFACRPTPARAPRSSYWMLRWWIASIYLWAGIYKLRADWLDGRGLDILRRPGFIEGWLADQLLSSPLSRAIVAKAVAVFELSIGPLLLWGRSRRYAIVAAYAFHIGLEIMAHPDLLGWGMMSLLLCFVADAGDSGRAQLRPQEQTQTAPPTPRRLTPSN